MSLKEALENAAKAQELKGQIYKESVPSPGQISNFGGMLAPGAGILDAKGLYPSLPSRDQPFTEAFSNEPYLSMDENLARGGWGYLDAGLQGLGVAGDALYASPYFGPPLGATLKGLGALGAVMRAGSKAGKGAKTETGIATLGKEPMFTPEDTLNLAYTPDGSYSPAIKDLIEKAPPSLKGQGIVQWANKNLKPKELEFLGIDEFIKDNPKATLRETVEGVSGNKVVVGKKILGGDSSDMNFETTYPLEDPLDGSKVYQHEIDNLRVELGVGGVQEGDLGFDKPTQILQDRATRLYNRFASESNVAEVESFEDIPKSDNDTYEKTLDAIANVQYMENPYELIRATGNVGEDTFAFGNEEVGYQLFLDGKRVTDEYNIAYSPTEAQIQLRGAMAEEESYGSIYGATQYKGFMDATLPGGKNYREIVYTFEGAPETHQLAHSGLNPDEGNYLAHALVRDRRLDDYTETLHGDEIQADIHKEGAKYGYKTPENIEKIQSELSVAKQKILKQADIVEDMLIKKGVYTKQEPSTKRIYNYNDEPDITNNQRIANELNEIRKTDERGYDTPSLSYDDSVYSANRLEDFLFNNTDIQLLEEEAFALNKLSETASEARAISKSIDYLVPNYPYKDDYHEMAIKKMLLQAVEEGKPAISISGSGPIKARYETGNAEIDVKNFRFYENLYDKKIPSYMQKLANKYGGEFQKNSKLDFDDTFIKEPYHYDELFDDMHPDELLNSNVIKITEEMRNKILLEGIPDFATGGIVNKGIARLRTAKQPTEGIVDLGLY